MGITSKLTSRQKIKYRIRKRVIGTGETPRLNVFRSLSNIYASLIDDISGKTLLTVSTLGADFKTAAQDKMKKTDKSKIIGKLLAQKALEMNIKKIVFDRNGYLFHGRIKAIAEGAREGGLQF
ncbi:MAG: 50S ribosomal protein L18 [Ignavibacteriae bacterium]|nr:MAG: 50S ribosomal protein L18 [Ignavibacteriota bacterium]